MSVFPKMLRVFKVCIIYVFVAHGQYNVDDVHGADQRYHLLHSGIRSHFNWYLTSDNVSLMLFCLLHVCTVNQRFSIHHKLPPSFFSCKQVSLNPQRIAVNELFPTEPPSQHIHVGICMERTFSRIIFTFTYQ